MERSIAIVVLIIVTSLHCWGCTGDDTDSADDSGVDGGDTDVDTDSDTDSDTDTDTGENETPPELPDLCDIDVMDLPASGEGDGRWPDVAENDGVLIAWAYDEQEGTIADWDIQLASYEPGPDGGIGAPDEPIEPSVLSEKPFMVARGDGYGLGWFDTRWDTTCNVLNQDDCEREIAFITLDSTGQPANPDPIQATSGAHLDMRPSIAATDTGFLMVWVEQDGGSTNVLALALDESGNPGDQQLISGDEPGSLERRASVAVHGTTAVVAWLSEDQNHLFAQPLALDATPAGDRQIIYEGALCGRPHIIAGDGEFLVAWSMTLYEDFEVYTRKLDSTGAPVGDANRSTWTTRDAAFPVVAWNGSDYALIYVSPEENGTGDCTHSSCKEQAFAVLLDGDGVVASTELMLSDNPNASSEPDLTWDGGGWFAVWELRQDMRQQVYYGRMLCD